MKRSFLVLYQEEVVDDVDVKVSLLLLSPSLLAYENDSATSEFSLVLPLSRHSNVGPQLFVLLLLLFAVISDVPDKDKDEDEDDDDGVVVIGDREDKDERSELGRA
mmetsp:Transcript_5607/g.6881  ORF Transcript_5607/g.6881 Transcript_5607/m.6881 type:complete len:106 (-) Transcript_5607:40-357(-)